MLVLSVNVNLSFLRTSMKIWFFGTPHLAAQVLWDLIENSRIEIAFVVTNPDKPVGRDQILTPTPVKSLAIEKGIPVYTPLKIRENTEFLETIDSYGCDYYIVVAYGKILPKVLLDQPKKMCINIHGSILPKYRGASPIQAALLVGETETGVTIMQMSEGMDEGDILKIRTIPIDPDETSGTLFEKFALVSGQTLIQTLLELEHGGVTPLPQDHDLATYCKKNRERRWNCWLE
jgi:methionyl-tRNA formyltransferase